MICNKQARRTSASLQKFKLIHAESHLDLEVKKMVGIEIMYFFTVTICIV